MPFDPDRHHRHSLRLPGYSYARPGAYFVTVCVQGHLCLLGEVMDGVMHPSPAAEAVLRTWRQLPDRFPGIGLDAFVIMPNHVHGIIILKRPGSASEQHGRGKPDPHTPFASSVRAGQGLPTSPSALPTSPPALTPSSPGSTPALGDVMCVFKSLSTRAVHGVLGSAERFWQRNYYDHIIRDPADLARIRAYIAENPSRWLDDPLHPSRPTPS